MHIFITPGIHGTPLALIAAIGGLAVGYLYAARLRKQAAPAMAMAPDSAHP